MVVVKKKIKDRGSFYIWREGSQQFRVGLHWLQTLFIGVLRPPTMLERCMDDALGWELVLRVDLLVNLEEISKILEKE